MFGFFRVKWKKTRVSLYIEAKLSDIKRYSKVPESVRLLCTSKKLSPGEREVYKEIYRLSIGMNRPTIKISRVKMASNIGVSENTIVRAIRSLVKKNLIASKLVPAVKGHNAYKVYWIIPGPIEVELHTYVLV